MPTVERCVLLRVAAVLAAVVVLLAGAFFWYVSDYYRAEDVALAVLSDSSGITVEDNLTVLAPLGAGGYGGGVLSGRQGGGDSLPAAAGQAAAERADLHPGGICPSTWPFLM